jgi:hypothetical protein
MFVIVMENHGFFQGALVQGRQSPFRPPARSSGALRAAIEFCE